MPYSGPEDPKLPDYIQEKPLADREKWVAVWNDSYSSCISDGGSTEDCESEAFAAASASIRVLHRILKREDDYPTGQCPYQDCCHNLSISDAGWYRCGFCERALIAGDTILGFTIASGVTLDDCPPGNLPLAEDLGPSWATPKEDGVEDSMDKTEELGLLKQILKALDRIVRGSDKADTESKERAVSLSLMAEQIWMSMEGEDGWPTGWLIDLYQEEGTGQVYGLVAQDAKLFRIDVSVDEGNKVSLGNWVEVGTYHTPVGEDRALTTVMRQADGTTLVAAVVCTAVMNRMAEIDATVLFDSFVEYAEETGNYPDVNVYHLGEESNIGKAVHLMREDYLYLAVYKLDDTPHGRAAAIGLAEDPDYWGHSIEFMATDYEMVEVADGVFIPAYTEGVNTAISILPEKRAASLFTHDKITRGVLMTDEAKEALMKLFGDDEELVDGFVTKIDSMNRQIEIEGLIVRMADDETESDEDEENVDEAEVEEETEDATDEVEEEDSEAEDDETEDDETEEDEDEEAEEEEDLLEIEAVEEETVVEIGDEIIEEVTQSVLQSEVFQTAIDNSETLTEIRDTMKQLVDRMNEAQGTNLQRLNEVDGRLDTLEEEEDDKLVERVAGLPRQRHIQVIKRPTVERTNTDDEAPDYDAIAKETMAQLQPA